MVTRSRVPVLALAAGLAMTFSTMTVRDLGARSSLVPPEISETALGLELAKRVSDRRAAEGESTEQRLRVWVLGPDDYFVSDRLPPDLTAMIVDRADGTQERVVGFSTELVQPTSPPILLATSDDGLPVALSPTWTWVNQYCFARMGSASLGYLDSCYVIHRLVNETDPRDFYKLEQYGSLGAGYFNKAYSGFLEAQQASGSATMSWIDWSPRSTITGGCQTIGLSVSALGASISSSGVMCERWNITKWSAGGHFKEEWSCGCIVPFGQPYPNVREIDYMQAISVPNGGSAIWQLSAGYVFF